MSLITVGLHKLMEPRIGVSITAKGHQARYLFDRQGRFLPQARTQRELLRIGFAPAHQLPSGPPFGFKLLGQDSSIQGPAPQFSNSATQFAIRANSNRFVVKIPTSLSSLKKQTPLT